MSTTETRAALDGLNIGVTPNAREAVAQLLNVILSDENVLLVKTRKAHWDVVGPQFHSLHLLWDEHYVMLNQRIDQLAERVRMLGHFPVATMRGWLEHSRLREDPGHIATASEAVIALTRDHETVARSLRDAVMACSESHRDVGTADMFTRLLQDHEQMAWMLRAFVEGEAIGSSYARPRSAPNDA